jgi:hypothetical protein
MENVIFEDHGLPGHNCSVVGSMDISDECAAFFFRISRYQDISIHVQLLFPGIWY